MGPTMHHSKSVLNAYGFPFLLAINSCESKALARLAQISKATSYVVIGITFRYYPVQIAPWWWSNYNITTAQPIWRDPGFIFVDSTDQNVTIYCSQELGPWQLPVIVGVSYPWSLDFTTCNLKAVDTGWLVH